jgi:hypothetical protein
MPFQKENPYSYKSEGEEPLDKHPVCFNVRVGVREELKKIKGWQNRMRTFADEMIQENLGK